MYRAPSTPSSDNPTITTSIIVTYGSIIPLVSCQTVLNIRHVDASSRIITVRSSTTFDTTSFIVTSVGRTSHVPLPLAAAAQQLYLIAEAAGLGAQDDSSVVTILSPKTETEG